MPVWICLLILLMLRPVLLSSHSSVGHVVIAQIQVGGAAADDEFVSLYNPTDCPIDLAGYVLRRQTASGATQGNLVGALAGTISPHGYFLIASPEYTGSVNPDFRYTTTHRLAANNTVILYADQARTVVVDQVGMGTALDFEGTPAPNPAPGESIVREDNRDTDDNGADFTLITAPTPQNSETAGPAGPCTAPAPAPPPPPPVGGPPLLPIAEAKRRPDGEEVTVAGAVTAEPGRLSTTSFYIQDRTAGLQIYSSQGSFPQMTIGQEVTITGQLGEAYGERRIRVSSPQDVTVGPARAVNPLQVSAREVAEDTEGLLVKVVGTVSSTSGDTFFLADGSGEARVYIRAGTGIRKPQMERGDRVQVVGIVSQYRDTYRILPRLQEDVVLTRQAETDAPETDESEEQRATAEETPAPAGSVAGEETVAFATAFRPLPSVKEPSSLRVLGWGIGAVGGTLLLLVPLLVWEKRTGYLRARLGRRRPFSDGLPKD